MIGCTKTRISCSMFVTINDIVEQRFMENLIEAMNENKKSAMHQLSLQLATNYAKGINKKRTVYSKSLHLKKKIISFLHTFLNKGSREKINSQLLHHLCITIFLCFVDAVVVGGVTE